MKHFSRIITLLSIIIAFCGCKEEVIELTPVIPDGSASGIIISPEWEAADYQFKCDGIKDASFSIISKPNWLIIESNSGKFTDSVATMHGKATLETRFSTVGFYNDQMVISSGGKEHAIPLTYISEGNPLVRFQWAYNYHYAPFYGNELQVINSMDGILIWEIVSLPYWLKVNMDLFDTKSFILAQGSVVSIPLDISLFTPPQGILRGTIVLKTNDINKGLVEIPVTAHLGDPAVSITTERFDFGSSKTSIATVLANHGFGILGWRFEDLPEWLSISPASGILVPYDTRDVIFTCDRSKLQNSFNSATITLKSTDEDRPSVDIVFTVR